MLRPARQRRCEMKRLTKGMLFAETVVVACPACEHPVPHPKTWSQMWLVSDLDEMNGEEVACGCGQRVLIHWPKFVNAGGGK